MVATVDANQRPHGEPESAVWVQTQRHMTAGVQFAGQFQTGTQTRQRSAIESKLVDIQTPKNLPAFD
jgi:hypothetical protein